MDVTAKILRTPVPKSVRSEWNKLRRHGDFKDLKGRVGVGATQLRDALTQGVATAALQQKITDALLEMAAERRAAEKELEKQQLAALKNA